MWNEAGKKKKKKGKGKIHVSKSGGGRVKQSPHIKGGEKGKGGKGGRKKGYGLDLAKRVVFRCIGWGSNRPR